MEFNKQKLKSFLLLIILNVVSSLDIDTKGYVVFCPCMGRFGNQVDQFLGALSFSKGLGRTLVLPHWIEYTEKASTSIQVPFERYFQIDPLKEYTKVITMDEFMKHIAPKVWPKGKRTVLCFSFRGKDKSCQAKEGNPFGPYWDRFGVDFDRSEIFKPLSYDLSYADHKLEWKKKFPSLQYPVLAFTGAPGAFPILEKDVYLQKYLKWSDAVEKKANDFIQKFRPNKDEKFLAIHIRNGVDFKRACDHAIESKANHFFASAQCLGYYLDKGTFTEELCYPSFHTIATQVGKAIEETGVKHVYVAADLDHMIEHFSPLYNETNFVKYDRNDPHVDLSILSKADHAIVNCVSTFSAIVKRQRDAEQKTTDFWAFQPKDHSEL